MSSKETNRELKYKKKSFDANSCFRSWFVLFILILTMLVVYRGTSVYTVPYLGHTGMFSSNHNITLKTNETVNQCAEMTDKCEGKYIYIHDLPSQFNYDLLKNCSSVNPWINMCKYLVNSGFGPRINTSDDIFSSSGWFDTNQFTLEVTFHTRMKKYKCLTNDSSRAAAIFVPFYAGLEVGRYLWNDAASLRERDAASIELVEYLKKQPEWMKMLGRDHFLVLGRIVSDFIRFYSTDSDWGNRLLRIPEVQNMTTLIIESRTLNKSNFAIPYPTYFHPWNDNEVFSWQDKMRALRRPYFVSFAGAPRPQLNDSIRNEIISQCLSSKGKICKFMLCDYIENSCENPRKVMQLFQSSGFCLQPPGDSYTRRSIFDSILAGCIPVFFLPDSAYTQYLWHLPKNHTKYSVFIPAENMKKGNVSIVERLLQIPKEEANAMREEVIALIPKVIYASPDSKLERLEDAFDVSVKEVLKRIAKTRMEMKEAMGSAHQSGPQGLKNKLDSTASLGIGDP